MMSVKEISKKAIPVLQEKFGLKNSMAVPKITKVIVSTGTGKIQDKDKLKLIPDRLAKITGQKPAVRASNKSIAGFKLRAGDVVGHQVTLRGVRMYDFLDRLINVAIPRQRDFRGLKIDSIDEMGNFTIGLKEHVIFPETTDEELKNVFGMSITIVTTAKNKKESEALLRAIGLPFKK